MDIAGHEHGRIPRIRGPSQQGLGFIDIYDPSFSIQYFPVDFRKGIGPR